jgi:hypothetical protein
MATHQALSGVTDEAFLQRLVRSHAERYGESFWDFFTTHVAPRLPPRPILAPTGLFMLHDWIRRSLPDYLAWNMESSEDDPDITRQRGLRLFPVHNKYTTADWQWLLHEADFAVLRCGQLRPTHRMFVAIPTGS